MCCVTLDLSEVQEDSCLDRVASLYIHQRSQSQNSPVTGQQSRHLPLICAWSGRFSQFPAPSVLPDLLQAPSALPFYPFLSQLAATSLQSTCLLPYTTRPHGRILRVDVAPPSPLAAGQNLSWLCHESGYILKVTHTFSLGSSTAITLPFIVQSILNAIPSPSPIP